MQTIEFQVTGMTCEHCERAVTEEVTRVAGVRDVTVSAADGVLSVSADGPVDDAAVLAAVDEAGYTAERR